MSYEKFSVEDPKKVARRIFLNRIGAISLVGLVACGGGCDTNKKEVAAKDSSTRVESDLSHEMKQCIESGINPIDCKYVIDKSLTENKEFSPEIKELRKKIRSGESFSDGVKLDPEQIVDVKDRKSEVFLEKSDSRVATIEKCLLEGVDNIEENAKKYELELGSQGKGIGFYSYEFKFKDGSVVEVKISYDGSGNETKTFKEVPDNRGVIKRFIP